MKSKKTKKRKRKLQPVETENGNPEKVMKSNPVDSTVDSIPDAMPTRSVYRNQLEIGIRSRALVLVQVRHSKYEENFFEGCVLDVHCFFFLKVAICILSFKYDEWRLVQRLLHTCWAPSFNVNAQYIITSKK